MLGMGSHGNLMEPAKPLGIGIIHAPCSSGVETSPERERRAYPRSQVEALRSEVLQRDI